MQKKLFVHDYLFRLAVPRLHLDEHNEFDFSPKARGDKTELSVSLLQVK